MCLWNIPSSGQRQVIDFLVMVWMKPLNILPLDQAFSYTECHLRGGYLLFSLLLLFIIWPSCLSVYNFHGFAMDSKQPGPNLYSDQGMTFRITQVIIKNKMSLLRSSHWVKWSCLVLLGLQLGFPGGLVASPCFVMLSIVSFPLVKPFSCRAIVFLCFV